MLQHLPFASQILVALQVHQIVGCTSPLLNSLQLVASFPKSSRLRSVAVHFGRALNEPDHNVQLKTCSGSVAERRMIMLEEDVHDKGGDAHC